MTKALTKSFYISYTSDIDDRKYEGNFTTKKLNIGAMIKMGSMKSALAGGFSYNAVTGKGLPVFQENLTEMVAHCEAAIISRPEWFKDPLELDDHRLLDMVYEEVLSFENSFRSGGTKPKDDGRRQGEDTQAQESGGKGSSTGSMEHSEGPSDSREEVVGRKVPFITKVG